MRNLAANAFLNRFVICIYDTVHNYEHLICNVSRNGRSVIDSVPDPDLDPYWIRTQSGLIRIRIHEGKKG
jgi:hypothetical protein